VRTRPTSLRRRITLSGVAVITVLVLALDVFVYLSLRDRMVSNLEQVLDAREQLAAGLAADLTPVQVSERLDETGVRAIVRADGEEYRSAEAPSFDELPAGSPGERETLASRTVPHPDGGEIVVLASRTGIEATLDRLLLLEAVGSIVVVALAWLALARSSSRVLRPVRDVATTARSIAQGSSDRRLEIHDRDDELSEMTAAFNAMLDALDEALRRSQASEETARRFLADAAHQLRTPAAGIRASVGTLLRSEDPEERDQLLDNLARESARMSRLLSALLRVARLDTGEATERRPISLEIVLADLHERQRALAPHLRWDLEVCGHARILGDPVGVREAVGNILDNAARHARSVVTVTIRDDGDAVETRIVDDGPGVPPGQRDRIFDRFVSLDDGGGSGLGLPIARGIAVAHGGTLVHDGAGFVLRLPRLKVS
jgi:two-component system, OmpR family, sensor kinase